jgi:hypothetical protein
VIIGKGGCFIVARNPGATDKPPAQAYIDHFCFTLSNWEEVRVRAAMNGRMGAGWNVTVSLTSRQSPCAALAVITSATWL